MGTVRPFSVRLAKRFRYQKTGGALDVQFFKTDSGKAEFTEQHLFQSRRQALFVTLSQAFQERIDIGKVKCVDLLPGTVQAAQRRSPDQDFEQLAVDFPHRPDR